MAFTLIRDSGPLTLTENADPPTIALRVPAGLCRIDIDFEPGAAGTITPASGREQSYLKTCTEDGEPIVATASKAFMLYGPTLLACTVSGISGTIKVACEVCMR